VGKGARNRALRQAEKLRIQKMSPEERAKHEEEKAKRTGIIYDGTRGRG
jgi:hypothetical protein